MDCRTVTTTLDDLKKYRKDVNLNLKWSSPFILPEWLDVWWRVFGSDFKPYIRAIFQSDEPIGIAPLMTKNGTAYFMGSTDVCDYQDFIISNDKEKDFFATLLEDLKQNGIKQLDLKHIRPDSTVMKVLFTLAENRKHKTISEQEAVSFEMDLPSSFEEYLNLLTSKQRHEVRRKMRRLSEEGNIVYRTIDKGEKLTSVLETFFKMFVESRQDKAEFMTEEMKDYFQQLTIAMSNIGLLKLEVLELDDKPIAEIMCFDYNDCIYLYNSGYDPQYVSLSAGLLSKVYAIKDDIKKGKKKFDFLKGAETYKGHLGGKEVPLYRCRIDIV
jgi:CelD/BcsL family acetyltransferase involved in cellulose biosynthesis